MISCVAVSLIRCTGAVHARPAFQCCLQLPYRRVPGPAESDFKLGRAMPMWTTVITLNQALGLGQSLGVVVTNQRLKTYEMSLKADGISSVLCHPGLFQRPQFAGKELGDLRGPQRVIAGAIETLEFATARFPEQESHGLAAFWTGGRRGVFGHDASRWIRREYRTHCHRLMPRTKRRSETPTKGF